MEALINTLKSFLEPTSIVIVLVILLFINSWIFNRLKSVKTTGNIIKNTISFLVILIGSLAFILSLPIEKELKGQILSFLAIVISAGIALSSTTVLGNLIAGLMNNSMKRFRIGDLIKIGDLQGRVTKRSVFHTEIQLEDSNFVTIPNLFIATNPVKLTRKANTVLSTSVSLGYDVPRTKIEESLKEAAFATGLKDPYVYITLLGDYSVTYKIHGFLEDSNKFFSTSSLLNANVMDCLHKSRIEIVSPTFMNQRRVDEKEFIPTHQIIKQLEKEEVAPEELVFDEAIKSEKIEKKRDLLKKIEERKEWLKERLKELKEEEMEEKEKVKSQIDRLEKLKETLEKNIEEESSEGESS